MVAASVPPPGVLGNLALRLFVGEGLGLQLLVAQFLGLHMHRYQGLDSKGFTAGRVMS